MPIIINEVEIETFLIENWSRIFDFKFLERQKQVGVGIIDILGYDETSREYIVIEIKTDDFDDSTIGQIQRYMGWVGMNLCKNPERVRGIILSHGVNKNLECALTVTNRIEWYAYQLHPRLFKIQAKKLSEVTESTDSLEHFYISNKKTDLHFEFEQIPQNNDYELKPTIITVHRDGVEVGRLDFGRAFNYEDPWPLIKENLAKVGDEICIIQNKRQIAKMTTGTQNRQFKGT